jgi:hypothetical protein
MHDAEKTAARHRHIHSVRNRLRVQSPPRASILRRSLAASALLAMLAPMPAQAGDAEPIGDSGNAFLARCGDEKREPCRAYVSGIVDGLMVAGIAMKTNLICPPPGVTTSQVHDLVVDFTRGSPALRHLRTDELTFRALKNAFPCPTKKAPPKRR